VDQIRFEIIVLCHEFIRDFARAIGLAQQGQAAGDLDFDPAPQGGDAIGHVSLRPERGSRAV